MRQILRRSGWEALESPFFVVAIGLQRPWSHSLGILCADRGRSAPPRRHPGPSLAGGREVALVVERLDRPGERLVGLGLAAQRFQHGTKRQVAVAVQVEDVGGRG